MLSSCIFQSQFKALNAIMPESNGFISKAPRTIVISNTGRFWHQKTPLENARNGKNPLTQMPFWWVEKTRDWKVNFNKTGFVIFLILISGKQKLDKNHLGKIWCGNCICCNNMGLILKRVCSSWCFNNKTEMLRPSLICYN